MHPSVKNLLQFFEYDHLPEHLQVVSKPISIIAHELAGLLPHNAELIAGLRKLLEAKDCLVRAKLAKETT